MDTSNYLDSQMRKFLNEVANEEKGSLNGCRKRRRRRQRKSFKRHRAQDESEEENDESEEENDESEEENDDNATIEANPVQSKSYAITCVCKYDVDKSSGLFNEVKRELQNASRVTAEKLVESSITPKVEDFKFVKIESNMEYDLTVVQQTYWFNYFSNEHYFIKGAAINPGATLIRLAKQIFIKIQNIPEIDINADMDANFLIHLIADKLMGSFNIPSSMAAMRLLRNSFVAKKHEWGFIDMKGTLEAKISSNAELIICVFELKKIKQTLKDLYERGFLIKENFNSRNLLFFLLITHSSIKNTQEEIGYINQIFNYLLRRGAPINSYNIFFTSSAALVSGAKQRELTNVPDSIILAAMYGNTHILDKLLDRSELLDPFAIVLYIYPWLENDADAKEFLLTAVTACIRKILIRIIKTGYARPDYIQPLFTQYLEDCRVELAIDSQLIRDYTLLTYFVCHAPLQAYLGESSDESQNEDPFQSSEEEETVNESEGKDEIADESQEEDETADESVQEEETVDESVEEDETADESVEEEEIVDESVEEEETVDESVEEDETADESVEEEEIVDESVEEEETADESVEEEEIVDESVEKEETVDESEGEHETADKPQEEDETADESVEEEETVNESAGQDETADESLDEEEAVSESEGGYETADKPQEKDEDAEGCDQSERESKIAERCEEKAEIAEGSAEEEMAKGSKEPEEITEDCDGSEGELEIAEGSEEAEEMGKKELKEFIRQFIHSKKCKGSEGEIEMVERSEGEVEIVEGSEEAEEREEKEEKIPEENQRREETAEETYRVEIPITIKQELESEQENSITVQQETENENSITTKQETEKE